MTWVIVGLGNPGAEYNSTRHNTGRMALEHFARAKKIDEWKDDKKSKAHVAQSKIAAEKMMLVAPDTFMNKSGSAVSAFVKSHKAAEKLVVVYDDLDLPLGSIKVSFDRGSGGHKGLESVIRAVKTKKFARIRIGVSPITSGGKLKKPSGEEEVVEFILAKFKPAERDVLKKVFKRVEAALDRMIEDGVVAAMNEFN